MNAPNRHDLFVLEDGEKGYNAHSNLFNTDDVYLFYFYFHRVEVIEDTKIPNAATFKVIKQDHTLANMLRAYVLCSSASHHY